MGYDWEWLHYSSWLTCLLPYTGKGVGVRGYWVYIASRSPLMINQRLASLHEESLPQRSQDAIYFTCPVQPCVQSIMFHLSSVLGSDVCETPTPTFTPRINNHTRLVYLPSYPTVLLPADIFSLFPIVSSCGANFFKRLVSI